MSSSSPFQTEQMTLAELFNGKRVFSFPAFQRPYRWTMEEAITLIDDVAAAANRKDAGYFLGNLVMTEANGRDCMVIDGRQRLTTLFMLLCILRDLEKDANRKRGLHRLVRDERDNENFLESSWRLRFAPAEQTLIENRISAWQALNNPSQGGRIIPERYLTMFEVADGMRELLTQPINDTGLPRLNEFTDYLLNNCEVIVLTASSATSGLRLFQVLNNRGLQLSEADLTKPDLLKALPIERQADAAIIWDGLEDRLGSDNLDTLLRAMVFATSGEWVPQGRTFGPSLKAAMIGRGPEQFHFEDLQTYGDAFADIHWGDIPFDEPEENPNHLIRALYFLGRSANEWKEFIPVAMEILVQFDGNYGEIYRHIRALDRLVFVWFINETSEGPRRRTCSDAIAQLRNGQDVFASGNAFDVPQIELEKAIEALSKPFPKLYQRGALLRRIELGLCERDGQPAPPYLELATSEHVLPKNPRQGSQWQIDFTRAEHRECLDLLGNGVPISRDLDKRVANRDYNAKRSIYKESGADLYFRSVADVCSYKQWTPAEIRARTAKIADMIATGWRTIPTEPIPDEFDFDDEDSTDAELFEDAEVDEEGIGDVIAREIDAKVNSQNGSD